MKYYFKGEGDLNVEDPYPEIDFLKDVYETMLNDLEISGGREILHMFRHVMAGKFKETKCMKGYFVNTRWVVII